MKSAPIDSQLRALLRRCESLPDSLDRRLLLETQASVQAQIEQLRQQADDVMTEWWDLHSATSACLEAAARHDQAMLPVWKRFSRLPTPGYRNPMRHVLQLQSLLQIALQASTPVPRSPEPKEPSPTRGAGCLLTAKDVTAELGISDKTIYRLAKEGRIPYVRIQSNLRFRRSDLDEWLASKSFQVPAKRAPRRQS